MINSRNNFPSIPDLMTVRELMDALSIGRTKAYELIHSGSINYMKIGRQIRIPKKSLLDYLNVGWYNLGQADGLRVIKGGDYESNGKPER